jgi:hypothetical protein
MLKVNLTPKHWKDNGSYGHYFVVNDMGVKIPYCQECADRDDFESLTLNQCKFCHHAAYKELKQLRMAYRARKVLGVGIPRPFGLVSARANGVRLIGVAMEHIKGDHPSEDEHHCFREEDGLVFQYLYDGHRRNFIVSKTGQWYRIDLGTFDFEPRFKRCLRTILRRRA